MMDCWLTDMNKFLDEKGRIVEGVYPRGFINYFGKIIMAMSAPGAPSQQELDVKCRRRPGGKGCPGKIHAEFQGRTTNIQWYCSGCRDEGLIFNWEGTIWDNRESSRLRPA